MIRTYIIRLSDNELSLRLAFEALRTARSLGYDAEYFEGVQNRQQIAEYLLNYQLIVNHKGGDIATNWGTMGCFVSHHKLWRRAVELDEPIVIMEHDALPLHDCTNIVSDVEHACHLDRFLPFNSSEDPVKYFKKYNERTTAKLVPGIESYPYQDDFYHGMDLVGTCFRGAYAYIIMPAGARRVLDFVKINGAFPADMCLCSNAIALQGTKSTYVRLNPFFNDLETQRRHTTRK